jgi:hypothetical protein
VTDERKPAELREAAPGNETRTEWLVELFHEGKSEGYWTGPTKDRGGWRTDNAWAAKQYTESEAKAVAAALDYFHAPFRWSHWVATEHIFRGVDDHIRPAAPSTSPLELAERAREWCFANRSHRELGPLIQDLQSWHPTPLYFVLAAYAAFHSRERDAALRLEEAKWWEKRFAPGHRTGFGIPHEATPCDACKRLAALAARDSHEG